MIRKTNQVMIAKAAKQVIQAQRGTSQVSTKIVSQEARRKAEELTLQGAMVMTKMMRKMRMKKL